MHASSAFYEAHMFFWDYTFLHLLNRDVENQTDKLYLVRMETAKYNFTMSYNFKTKTCREIPVCFIIYKN